ncbi:MAG: hypothetical protein JRJ65_06675 [Deltaproteobacteria bacterium]|nr:hypothetical protein [Deltaproteobacteria bacterium]
MKMRIMLWFFTMFLSLFLIGSMSIAKEKGKGRPSGWDKGEKKGWQGDVPPGQEKKLKAKKAEKKKERWENMSEEEREATKQRRREDLSEEERKATMEKRKLETKKRWEDLSEEERKAIFEKYKTNKK